MSQDNKYIKSLIENARRGKIGSLEELFEMCLADIYTLIVRLTGDKKLAERFTIDTLITAWKEIQKDAPEHISFENWLRNIAIKITICGLIGSNDCEKRYKKKSSLKSSNREAYSSDPLENAIAGLDDESRAIFVLNKIEGKPLASFSGFLGVTKIDAETKLSDSVSSITNVLPNMEAFEGLDNLVEFLPEKLEPNDDLLESALSEINEIRIEQPKERDVNSEEHKELIELEKKRKVVLKKRYKQEKVAYKKEKRLKSSDKMIISILLLTSCVSFILFLFTTTTEWKLSSATGNPLKNKRPINTNEEILPGDIISTNAESTAGIDMADIGRLNIFGNTTVSRLEEDNKAELSEGTLKVNTVQAKENFQITVPEAFIENVEFGTRYLVDVQPNGYSHIVLEKGWLRVNSDGYETIFPQKYNLKIVKGSGVSLPYYFKSSLVLVSLFEEYLFNGRKSTVLNRILQSSTDKEAVMLWNLLPRVSETQRKDVYDRLYELIPHTKEISKADMLSLEKSFLQIWLDEIKWYL
jgi:DNA-directed RNA polymerase specialized sigma24 family protein